MVKNIDEPDGGDGTTDDGEPILSVRALEKTYGSGEGAVTAVDGVSFDVASGTIVGLLGHNGAGKTTIIKTTLGLVLPTDGTVLVDGTDVHEHLKETSGSVAAVLEGARNVYWRLTVRENLNFFARIAGVSPNERRARHDRLLEQLDLLEWADTEVNELSRGMKQKVSLAAMLAREPDVLFLDEPTMGLDVESSLALRREINRIVRAEEMTVIISSHDMDVIEDLCDRVIILDRGSIVVDDSIEALHDLFESQDLELTIEGTAPESFREALEADYHVESWDVTSDRTHVRLRIEDIEVIEDVLSLAFGSDLRLLDVRTTQIDMEDIYLNVTDSTDGEDREDTEEVPSHA